MIKRRVIYNLHRKHDGVLFRHSRQSANILSRLTFQLDKYPMPYRLNFDYPYQLIVYCNGRFSLHAGGFDKRIDMIPLKTSGEPCNTKYKRAFQTPKGVVNYILSKYGKGKVNYD